MSHKAAQAATPAPVQSAFGGVNNYAVDLGGLASGSAKRNGDSITATGSLDPSLQPAQSAASSGLASNLSFLGQNPTQQLQSLDSGGNDFYNLLQKQSNRDFATQQAALANQAANSGVSNSTAAGGAIGALNYQKDLLDLQNKMQAMGYLNQTANQNAGTEGGALSNLANLEMQPATLANNNLFNAFGQNNQVGLSNNQLAGQIAQTNAQLKQQQNQANQAAIGSLIGGIGSLAAIPLAGAFGPLAGFGKLASLGNGIVNTGAGALSNFGGLTSGAITSPMSYFGNNPYIGAAA